MNYLFLLLTACLTFITAETRVCKSSGPSDPDRALPCCPGQCWRPYVRQGCYCDDFCRVAGDCCGNFYGLCKKTANVDSRYRYSVPPNSDLATRAEGIGKSIMSEAGGEFYATREEEIAIGYASQRNPKHVTSTKPTWAVQDIADDVAIGKIPDNTQGANHWYSPNKMPKEGDSCAKFDCGGGLEQTPGMSKKNYKPSWANEQKYIPINGYKGFEFPNRNHV